jgi:hypothetical protein
MGEGEGAYRCPPSTGLPDCRRLSDPLVLLLDLKVDRPGFCAPALALPDALLAGTEFRAEAID